MTTRLVLADDHPIVLDGLAHLIGHEPALELVARCGDGEAALRAARQHRPDILVLDLRMPRLDGLEVVRRLAADGPATKVVVLSGTLDEDGRLGVGSRTELANHARAHGLLR